MPPHVLARRNSRTNAGLCLSAKACSPLVRTQPQLANVVEPALRYRNIPARPTDESDLANSIAPKVSQAVKERRSASTKEYRYILPSRQ